MPFKVNLYGSTDVGRQRGHNEDSFGIIYNVNNEWKESFELSEDISNTKGILAVVADGMGGTNAGEVASDIAVKSVLNTLKSTDSLFSTEIEYGNFLISAINKAHKQIVVKAKQDIEMQGMGTTIVVIWIVQGYVYIAWSGDSRCYFYNKDRNKNLNPFTDDHSLVWTRVKSGEISPEEARISDDSNLILQSLGDNNQNPNPEFIWTKLGDHDRILLCSDGLNSMLSDVGIQQILDYNSSAKDSCISLIKAANNAGGSDNITVVLADILSTDSIPLPVEAKKPPKKSFFGRWILIILLIIVALSFFFREDILAVYEDFKKSYSIQQVNDSQHVENIKDTIIEDSAENAIHIEQIRIQNTTSPDNDNSTKLKHEKTDNQIDTAVIKTELTKALVKIDKIQERLELAESNFDTTFYKINKEKLESLNDQLDSLSEEIKNVAKVNVNNVIEIIDYEKAPKIQSQINTQIDDINKEIKSITEKKVSNLKELDDNSDSKNDQFIDTEKDSIDNIK